MAAGIMATALSVALLLPAAAQAEERVCRGTLGAITVDNLRVPQNATCTLSGTRVKGTVKVERNAVLNAPQVRVIGNVQGENARNVVRRAARGSAAASRSSRAGRRRCATAVVTGDILYDDNRPR